MQILWYGQSCFQLRSKGGDCVICDPYHPAVGYAPHPQSPAVVTISHEHMDHNWLGWLQGEYKAFRGIGPQEHVSIKAIGLHSFHDGELGIHRGENTIFIVEVDGIKVCHLGDLGHEPDEELYSQLAGIDVLLVPVGGHYTIDAVQAAAIVKHMNPPLTIPMHFNTGVKETPIAGVEAFAALTGAVHQGSSTLDFSADYSGPQVVILDYLR